MGCDVHMYIERRVGPRVQRDDRARFHPVGSWIAIAPPERDLKRWPVSPESKAGGSWGPDQCMRGDTNRCYGMGDAECIVEGCQACLETGRDLRWWRNRNYRLFGMLAGVRDEELVKWDPRGVPKDVSSTIRDHNFWDHTPSWLGLHELLREPWDRTSEHAGTIKVFSASTDDPRFDDSLEAWLKRGDEGKQPQSWSGNVGGYSVVQVDLAKAKLMLRKGKPNDGKDYYTRITWTESDLDSVGPFVEFLNEIVVPATLADTEYFSLKAVRDDAIIEAKNHPEIPKLWDRMMAIASNVRIVFGFDN